MRLSRLQQHNSKRAAADTHTQAVSAACTGHNTGKIPNCHMQASQHVWVRMLLWSAASRKPQAVDVARTALQ
jgi:hypothetical protein